MTRETGIAQEVVKAAPPVSIAGASLFGISFSDWVLVLTAIYILCQLVVISPKVYHTFKTRRKRGK
jgi:hypothetical protein